MPEHDQHQANELVGQPDARDPAPVGVEAPHLADAAWQGAGLGHRTAQASRHALLLDAQHTHGNAWVARALAARQPAGEGAGAAAPEADPAATAGVIVGDDADPGPGQMSRSAFLDQLRSKAAEAAAEALEGTIWALTAG